ncbi:hypothetical protein KM043_018197 [Ampulex compressa]|nr:hypothetical protein KM043_018197 [Ampulex compressa]
MRRRTGPIQQWVDSIPSPTKSNLVVSRAQQESLTDKLTASVTPTEPKDILFSTEAKLPSMTVSTLISVPNSPAISATSLPKLVRDPSLQSDSSHCSSVESLLELRKADPEAILLGLGFGGCSATPQENGPLSRIPRRFLQPSKLKGIAINDFVKHQQETSESFDSVSLGYRGLTGSPYVAPSEIVQKIMERLREHESHEIDTCTTHNSYDQYSSSQQNGTFSVLSPDNRQFLEQPRSKSPDMRNKRMIIGQKSFAFGCDGDLIEISPSDKKEIFDKDLANDYSDREHFLLAQKTNKRLSKQFSFDDNAEFDDSEINPLSQHPKTVEQLIKDKISSYSMQDTDPRMVIDQKKAAGLDLLPKYSCETRRASDGTCQIAHDATRMVSKATEEGRRFSDGLVHDTYNQNNECLLLQKRKSLKRQSRVTDMEAMHYCNTNNSLLRNTADYRQFESSLQNTVEKSISDQNDQTRCKSDESNDDNPQSNIVADLSTLNNNDDIQSQTILLQPKNMDITEKAEVCGSKECSGQVCKHDDNNAECCCYTDTTKYWEKMEKILEENKKLETMVKKSRKEMAEIREMLNSVLSVRMEPGF